MAWSKKKLDPVSDRSRALEEEIARVEAEIKRLGAQLERDQSHPRLRSTALPHRTTVSHSAQTAAAAPAQAPSSVSGASPGDPIFEEVDQNRLQAPGEAPPSADRFNDLGLRKYDLPALLRRLRSHFRGPSTTNPKLVSYLAAGGIHGLRPLRYETRVSRNRFIAFFAILLVILVGIVVEFVRKSR